MASFRFYKKKIRESKHTGSGAGDVYKPTWFAYPILNRFLGKKNIPVSTLNTDDDADELEKSESEVDDPAGDKGTATTQVDSPRVTEHDVGALLPTNSTTYSFLQHARKRQRCIDKDITKKMSIIQDSVQKPTCREKDECALYGDLIACKLRKLTEDDRDVCMNQIDNLIFSFISKRFKS